MSLAPTGRYRASVENFGLLVIDATTKKVCLDLHNWLGLLGGISMKWSTDSTHFVIGSPGYAYVWSSTHESLITRFPGVAPSGRFSGGWCDAALSPDGKQMVITDSANNRLYYWSDVNASISPTTRP